MKTNYVMDTSAWIEYFLGSKQALKIKDLVERGNTATPNLVVFELADKYVREGFDFTKPFQFILSNSKILDMPIEMAYTAASIKQNQRLKKKQFRLADAIIITLANSIKARIITSDWHFKDIENVFYLE